MKTKDEVEEILMSPRGTFLVCEWRKPTKEERLIFKALRKAFGVSRNCIHLTKIWSISGPDHEKQWNPDKRRYDPPFRFDRYVPKFLEVDNITWEELKRAEELCGFHVSLTTDIIIFEEKKS